MLNRNSIAVGMLVAVLIASGSDAAPVPAAWSGSSPSHDGFRNPGVYRQVINGNLYEWIPTQDVNFELLPDGAVRIVAPATKRSFNGTNDCRRFVYDHVHKRLAPADEAALFGPGLKLPPGNYGFAVLWLKAASYDEVLREPWNLTSNPDTFPSNSAQVDYVNLSVVPAAPAEPTAGGGVRAVALPHDLQRVSWLPHYQVLPYDLALPPDRGFGITRLLWDVPLEQVYRKATHIQYVYSELDRVPDGKKWRTMRAYDHAGKLASNEWLVRNHPLDKDFLTVSEMDENFGAHGIKEHAARAQQVLEGIYRRLERERNVTSPAQTRLYDDYFSHLEGFNNSVSFRDGFDAARLAEGLSSREMARKRLVDGAWKEDSYYFTKGAYGYRNWMQGGYLDSHVRTAEGVRVYNQIYDYERKFVAAPDRRVLTFGWSNAEGVDSNMYRAGTKSRLHFDGGDVIRQVEVAWPFHMMLNESFWALLLGNDYVLWHSSVRLVSDPHAFGDSWAAGAKQTQWQPAGGAIVAYDPRLPGHPKRVSSPKGQFPPNPHVGESGAFAGAWLVAQVTSVSDRTSKALEYCPFTYKINGGPPQPGYARSERPDAGSRGDASVSRYGVANPGQANIVNSYAARKPICVYGEGKDGAAVIYHNVYSGLTEVNEVTVSTRRGARTLRATGNSLHLFYLD